MYCKFGPALYIRDNSDSESIMISADSHAKMIATLDINYGKSGNSYLLTSVTGGWTIYDTVYILSQNLVFGCTGAAPATWSQVKYYIPGSSFSYNTGFTQYVPDDGGSDVGAILSFRLQYGETWDFVLTNKRLSSSLGVGGRW